MGAGDGIDGQLSARALLTTYAATKAFDRFFALGLAAEVARFGVKVTALCPGPTDSEFFQVAHWSLFKGRGLQSTAAVARQAVAGWRAAGAPSRPALAAVLGLHGSLFPGRPDHPDGGEGSASQARYGLSAPCRAVARRMRMAGTDSGL